MKESTRRKLLGKRLFLIYRRMRFLSYRKKALKRQQEIDKTKILLAKIAEKKKRKKNKKSLRYKIYRIFRITRFVYKRGRLNRKERKQRKAERKEAARIERLDIRARLKEKSRKDRLEEKRKELALKKENRELKREQRKYLRLRIKNYFIAFLYELRHFNRRSLRRWLNKLIAIGENKDKNYNFFVISVNSFSIFLISYLVIYIIGQIITILVSLSFDYNTILYYYKIYYNIDSFDWTADSVKILFSVLPLTGLLIGIILIILFSLKRNDIRLYKLFFLWGFIHGMLFFFGGLLLGTLLNKDFGWVIAYLYYRDTGKMIFSIFAIFSLVVIGVVIAKSFLISGNTYFNKIDKGNRKYLLMSQVILPAIFGSFVLVLLKIPNELYYSSLDEILYEMLKIGTIIIAIIPLAVSFGRFDEIYFDEEPRKIKLNWIILLCAIILVCALRFGLSSGIHFGS